MVKVLSNILVGLFLFILVSCICICIYAYFSFNESITMIEVNNIDGCNNKAIEGAIESYLNSDDRMFVAVRMLMTQRIPYSERINPWSFRRRLEIYYSARYVSSYIDKSYVARVLCSSPMLKINNKHVYGVPSIAAEFLGKNVSDLNEAEIFLVTCAVVAEKAESRAILMTATDAQSAMVSLEKFCGDGRF